MGDTTPKRLNASMSRAITPSSPYRIDIPHTPNSVHKRSSYSNKYGPGSPSVSSVVDDTVPSQLSPDALADGYEPPHICTSHKYGAEPPSKEDDHLPCEPCNSDGDSTVKGGETKKERVHSYKYDSTVELEKPLPRRIRGLLEITEIPFMIMWVYLTYWIVIVSLYAHKVKPNVWISAAVAGMLVGIGLNANAYRMIIAKGRIDYGVVIRFFLIPFGVSSLSGITNSLREEFLLVFPRDLSELVISLCLPAIVVSIIVVIRITVLWKLRVKLTFRSLFLNGTLSTKHTY